MAPEPTERGKACPGGSPQKLRKKRRLWCPFWQKLAGLDVTTREEGNRGSTTSHNFAWQVGAGFSYDLTDRVDLTLGYRYIDPGDASYEFDNLVDSPIELDTEIHEARAGIRFAFYDFPSPWR